MLQAIFAAMIPALMAMVLFYVDENVTSSMTDAPEHKLVKVCGRRRGRCGGGTPRGVRHTPASSHVLTPGHPHGCVRWCAFIGRRPDSQPTWPVLEGHALVLA